MKLLSLSLCAVCLLPLSCTKETRTQQVDRTTPNQVVESPTLTMVIGEESLTLQNLKALHLWTDDEGEVVSLDIEFSEIDHERIKKLTTDKQHQMMELQVGESTISKAMLVAELSSSVRVSSGVQLSEKVIADLESLLVEGKVSREIQPKQNAQSEGIVEAMENIFK